jgi:hypothetical protein
VQRQYAVYYATKAAHYGRRALAARLMRDALQDRY